MTEPRASRPYWPDALQNPPDASYRDPIREIKTAISQGATVTDALRRLGDWMPPFDIALIEAGEKSGRLDAVCKLLASYYEDRARLLRDNSLSKDLLEERARSLLGLSDPRDYVIRTSSARVG